MGLEDRKRGKSRPDAHTFLPGLGAAGSCGDRHLQPGISGGTHLRKIPPAEAGRHGVGMTQGMPLPTFPAGRVMSYCPANLKFSLALRFHKN